MVTAGFSLLHQISGVSLSEVRLAIDRFIINLYIDHLSCCLLVFKPVLFEVIVVPISILQYR